MAETIPPHPDDLPPPDDDDEVSKWDGCLLLMLLGAFIVGFIVGAIAL